LEQLQTNKVGRYIQYFIAMNWLSKIARKEVKAFCEPLMRTQPKLLNAQTLFNRDLFELDHLIIKCFSIPVIDFHAIFISFFRNVARFSENELRKAITVFLPYL
jgi:hypothetical protein